MSAKKLKRKTIKEAHPSVRYLGKTWTVINRDTTFHFDDVFQPSFMEMTIKIIRKCTKADRKEWHKI